MKVVGLTGGIGSGKTTVMQMFQKLGVPVYIADLEAKKLMHSSIEIKNKLIENFGTESYIEGRLNNSYLAEIVFTDKEKLKIINSIVHPVVKEHFKKNKENYTGPYLLFENAILFENGFDVLCDFVITITAPLDDRVQRIQLRDKLSREQIIRRVENQWSDKQKEEKSDFVINNTNLKITQKRVEEIHEQLLKKIENTNKLKTIS